MARQELAEYHAECRAALDALDLDAVDAIVDALLATRQRGGTVVIVGNGGSAATASHMATDLTLSSGLVEPPLRAVAVAENTALLTAASNDRGYAASLATPVELLGRPGDVLVAISASGDSANVLAAVTAARACGMLTIGLSGFGGGRLAHEVDLGVHVPTAVGAYGPVEDAHLAVNHMITRCLQRVARDEAAARDGGPA